MKDQKEIKVVYKHYIPEEWIKELESSIQATDILFGKAKDKDKYYNFAGPELADIIIFIRDNPESIFLAPALYDIVKTSIVGLWKKLTTLNVKKMQSSDARDEQKKISVRYEDSQQRQVTINIEGNLDND